MAHIGILGAGIWGTALGIVLARAGHQIHIWGRNKQKQQQIQTNRIHPALANLVLPDNLVFTDEIAQTAHHPFIIAATPTQTCRSVLTQASVFFTKHTIILQAAKGLETQNNLTLPQVMREALPSHGIIATLSGPGFAQEVAQGMPTATVIACEDDHARKSLLALFQESTIRPYGNSDITGVSLGGAIKNVLAMACGMALGGGYGQGAHASIATRGFQEMCRIGVQLNGHVNSFSGLSGLGDLMLTAGSLSSRNTAYGFAIGQHQKAGHTDLPSTNGQTIEGSKTAHALSDLAIHYNLDLPICSLVSQILKQSITVPQAMEKLLARPFCHE